MAMRALFGSLRLTKDIDFERDASLSNASLGKALPKALQSAALNAGLQAPVIAITKDTKTTIRASLRATLGETGEPVQYEVEISGRGLPPAENLVHLNVVPPMAYRITQFGVNSFDAHAMAATKIAALHSDNRSVPRDIFDLSDLIAQNANPISLLRRADPKWVEEITGNTLARASAMDWNRANEELLPYLPRSVGQSLDTAAWAAMCLRVAEVTDAWLAQAQRAH